MRGINFKHLLKTAGITALFCALFFISYSLLFVKKTYPNNYFARLNISGKSDSQLEDIVLLSIDEIETQTQSFVVGNKRIDIPYRELGITFDRELTLRKIQASRESDNLVLNFGKRVSSMFIRTQHTPVYVIDTSILSSIVEKNFIDLEKKAINANIEITEGVPRLIASENGVMVNRSKLINDLVNNLAQLNNKSIIASYSQDSPIVTSAQAKQAFNKVQMLDKQDISLVYEFDNWNLSGNTLLDLLEFTPKGFSGINYAELVIGNKAIALTNIEYLNKQPQNLEVGLNNQGIDALTEEISSVIDKDTVDATLEFDGLKVSRFTSAQDGQVLDRDSTRSLILKAISVDNLANEATVNIELPVKVSQAKVANDQINSLGIRELIASGVSYFTGSIVNRAYNIGFGSEFINGTLIPPGEIFSFNKLVGPVSGEQGFRQAYVINKGRTVLDDGGGICQVSTTVFRAALNAGLPIVERTAHAYRVSYYEQRGFEPGYDATIWSPTVDLKFKNDTDHHILVQAVVDPAQSRLQVDIYGTKDDRRVELSDVKVSNKKPAPEPLYQDDPTLSSGVVKQVDWAAGGLTSVFSRKVYKGGELEIEDTFRSNFRPWQAVYLVGTGT